MRITHFRRKRIALILLVGAMPFFSILHAKPVGLMYEAGVDARANYIWRGLYIGGPSLQATAMVGYGGFYARAWGNIGSSEPACQHLFPEIDATIGFTRWGLDISVTHMHYFDGTPFFDFHNYAPGEAGNTTEAHLTYVVSEKVPLSIAWHTRIASRDGYLDESGNLVRAWSSYFELGYRQKLPRDYSIAAYVGMTPWKSLYTNYQGTFAFHCIDLRADKNWHVGKHLNISAGARLMINPWRIDKENIQWNVYNPHQQRINADLHCNVSLSRP